MLKRDDLTTDERLLYMPTWEKIGLGIFAAILPILGSVVSINL